MTETPKPGLSLETTWVPAKAADTRRYILKLINRGGSTLTGFKLCVTGPARIEPSAEIEHATLSARLSNFSEFSPPKGFELANGATWTITVRGGNQLLTHWSSGANTAYLVLADGSTAPVTSVPTVARGNNQPLLKGTKRFAVPPTAPVPISVIPWPNRVAVSGRLTAPTGLVPHGDSDAARAAITAFGDLTARLFPAETLMRRPSEGGLSVALTNGDHGAEGYRIGFGKTHVQIAAASQTGFLYGLITLGQILRGAKQHPQVFTFPSSGEIIDRPAMAWRGLHLDVARQFYTVAEVSGLLAIMSWNKLNRFHWHLSDDEAWRVEIDAYPALTEVGAWRGHGLAIPPLLGSGPEPMGGYYTKDGVREVVALATSLGITVLPEIDIPGHCFAMQQAIPALRDPDETGEYFSVQSFPNNCLNPARTETFEILETIFDELIELFPSKIIHVGADEVPLGAWSGSPQALAQLRKTAGPAVADAHAARSGETTNLHGADEIDGSGAAILQAAFLARIQKFLASRGVITGGWEEAAHGDVIDKAASYLVGWRDPEVSGKLAAKGYNMVVSPGQAYYLDMSQSDEWNEPGAGWAGWSGVRETYEFDPVRGWTDAQLKHFMGVQACIWSECMTDRALFDRLVFPRLSAIAETGWSPASARSWDRFSAMAGLMPNLYGHWAE